MRTLGVALSPKQLWQCRKQPPLPITIFRLALHPVHWLPVQILEKSRFVPLKLILAISLRPMIIHTMRHLQRLPIGQM
jgi:hypothetical protein